MNWDLLLTNISNPAFLFFLLGIVSVRLKSDLEIPANSSKFISLYLLFSIGFKGGQELSHESINAELILSIFFGIALSALIPVYTFFILKKKFNIDDAGAIAAAYGSVSAVTFVTAVTYLENQQLHFQGHMVAIMALMESPSIIAGLILIRLYNKEVSGKINPMPLIKHSLTNGSVLLIIGSLIIGFFANAQQAEGIKPFTNDLFKGFLAIFLLDMGISSGKKLNSLSNHGVFPIVFAVFIPLINGVLTALISSLITADISNRFCFAILAASASYIAVPAAIKIAVPKANPGLFIPMALAITFPLNITLGMPLYMYFSKLIG
jgi:uncharacterized protein